MKKEDFIKELEEIFIVEHGTLRENSKLKDIDIDSTSMLGLVAYLAGELELEVDTDQLRKAETVRDLIALTDGKVQ